MHLNPAGLLVLVLAALPIACGSGAPALDPNATPSANLKVTAKNLHFDHRGLVLPAGASVTITFDNEDSGVRHNFAVYTSKRATEKIFVGDLFEGKKSMEYTVQAPAAGTYFFRCDSHPDTMTGTLVAK
jgi:plastocyanin